LLQLEKAQILFLAGSYFENSESKPICRIAGRSDSQFIMSSWNASVEQNFKELNKKTMPSFVPRKINKGGHFTGLQQLQLCNMEISGDYLRCKPVGKKLKLYYIYGGKLVYLLLFKTGNELSKSTRNNICPNECVFRASQYRATS
jgi:hypothetical protein